MVSGACVRVVTVSRHVAYTADIQRRCYEYIGATATVFE
jgi:hypothetical protein